MAAKRFAEDRGLFDENEDFFAPTDLGFVTQAAAAPEPPAWSLPTEIYGLSGKLRQVTPEGFIQSENGLMRGFNQGLLQVKNGVVYEGDTPRFGLQGNRMVDTLNNWLGDTSYDQSAIPTEFNWQEYINLNKDLAPAGIDTMEEAQRHYALFGKKEGRGWGAAPAPAPTPSPASLGWILQGSPEYEAAGGLFGESQQYYNPYQDIGNIFKTSTAAERLGFTGPTTQQITEADDTLRLTPEYQQFLTEGGYKAGALPGGARENGFYQAIFDAQGKEVPGTREFVSYADKDFAVATALLGAAAGNIAPLGMGFLNAAAALERKDPLGFIASAAGAVPGIPNVSKDIKNIADTVRQGTQLAKAVKEEDLLGALAAGTALGGVETVGDYKVKDLLNYAKAAKAVAEGDAATALLSLQNIVQKTDAETKKLIDIGGNILKAAQGDPIGGIKALIGIGNELQLQQDVPDPDAVMRLQPSEAAASLSPITAGEEVEEIPEEYQAPITQEELEQYVRGATEEPQRVDITGTKLQEQEFVSPDYRLETPTKLAEDVVKAIETVPAADIVAPPTSKPTLLDAQRAMDLNNKFAAQNMMRQIVGLPPLSEAEMESAEQAEHVPAAVILRRLRQRRSLEPLDAEEAEAKRAEAEEFAPPDYEQISAGLPADLVMERRYEPELEPDYEQIAAGLPADLVIEQRYEEPTGLTNAQIEELLYTLDPGQYQDPITQEELEQYVRGTTEEPQRIDITGARLQEQEFVPSDYRLETPTELDEDVAKLIETPPVVEAPAPQRQEIIGKRLEDIEFVPFDYGIDEAAKLPEDIVKLIETPPAPQVVEVIGKREPEPISFVPYEEPSITTTLPEDIIRLIESPPVVETPETQRIITTADKTELTPIDLGLDIKEPGPLIEPPTTLPKEIEDIITTPPVVTPPSVTPPSKPPVKPPAKPKKDDLSWLFALLGMLGGQREKPEEYKVADVRGARSPFGSLLEETGTQDDLLRILRG